MRHFQGLTLDLSLRLALLTWVFLDAGAVFPKSLPQALHAARVVGEVRFPLVTQNLATREVARQKHGCLLQWLLPSPSLPREHSPIPAWDDVAGEYRTYQARSHFSQSSSGGSRD